MLERYALEKYAPRIINSNIKTRRLGYIIALVKIIGNNFLFIDDALRRLESWAEAHQKEVEEYSGKSGLITASPKHYPAKRYFHLAKDLRLIKVSRSECAVTKIGQPILYLAEYLRNPFDLTNEQICYLLKRILENDSDCFLQLLRSLEKYNEIKNIFTQFKKTLLDHLEKKIEKLGDILKSSEIKRRRDKIIRWTEERKYLEHIIYPRLDWMTDLKILNISKRKEGIYEFTEEGKSFLSFLNEMEKANLENFDAWLENRYYEIFGQCFIKKEKNLLTTLNSEEHVKLISDLLEDAFRKFSSPNLPLSHMSAITFLEYSCTKLVVMGIIPSFNQLKDLLKRMAGYRFQWQPSMEDGFIIKI
ncbi:MAG: hypothetical protein QXG39_07195 [Candidatus Aenigmatarchaeota archaeon]